MRALVETAPEVVPTGSGPFISVVVPVYGCAGCLETLCSRLDHTLRGMASRYEVILVDDRSPDSSWAAITEISRKLPFVRGVRLSRNYGQHLAITAGLEMAQGDLVAVMDCDLQDPPELLPDLYAKLQEGYDFVLARRTSRSHSWVRVLAARVYFKLLGILTGHPIDGSYGSYCLLTRRVVDAFLRFTERERHLLLILRWLGFAAGRIDYEHADRAAGASSYSLRKLVRHAIEGMFFETTLLLRWVVFGGLSFVVMGALLALFFIFQAIFRNPPAGWTSLAVLLLLATGLITSCIGVTGLYVARIFEQIKGRPLYVIDQVIPVKPPYRQTTTRGGHTES
jgi:dolichol-phosphate mannosyltransferase